jgi:hypothetical protein
MTIPLSGFGADPVVERFQSVLNGPLFLEESEEYRDRKSSPENEPRRQQASTTVPPLDYRPT